VDNISYLGNTHDHSGDSGDGGRLTYHVFAPAWGSTDLTTGGTALNGGAGLPFIVDWHKAIRLAQSEGSTQNAVMTVTLPSSYRETVHAAVVLAGDTGSSGNIQRTIDVGVEGIGQALRNVTNSITGAFTLDSSGAGHTLREDTGLFSVITGLSGGDTARAGQTLAIVYTRSSTHVNDNSTGHVYIIGASIEFATAT